MKQGKQRFFQIPLSCLARGQKRYRYWIKNTKKVKKQYIIKNQCCVSGTPWIRIHLAVLDPDPYSEWECGS
jgi:hypothetical protein